MPSNESPRIAVDTDHIDGRTFSSASRTDGVATDCQSHKPRLKSFCGSETLFQVLVDITFAVLPCLFIALAIAAAHLDGRPISSYGNHVKAAAKLGPTIFPVLFAAIAARFNRHLATWQAERGQKLGVLEQLIQSQSLASTIESAYVLRNISLTSCVLVLLWSLSPIGGQSSLRVLTSTNVLNQSDIRVYPSIPWEISYFGGLSHRVNTQTVINGIITASLLESDDIRYGPLDTWGNVKVPDLKYLSNLQLEEWYTVDDTSTARMNYSNLIGFPVREIPAEGMANFSMFAPIFHTDCCRNFSGQRKDGGHSIFTDIVLSPSTETPDIIQQLSSSDPPLYMGLTASVYELSDASNLNLTQHFTCTLRTSRVEAAVSCLGAACRVARFRKSLDSSPDYINPWNDVTANMTYPMLKTAMYDIMLELLPNSAGPSFPEFSKPFDAYLAGWDHPFSKDTINKMNWTGVSETDFSTRLSVMFNTFWLASQLASSITTGPVSNRTEDIYSSPDGVAATLVRQNDVYKAQTTFVIILLLVSILLLLCALGSVLLRIYTIAPDIFGFVSSMTRDSRYFESLTATGSMLDGGEKSRALRELNVQIVDVRPADKIGRVAFFSVEDLLGGEESLQGKYRLRKGKVYE